MKQPSHEAVPAPGAQQIAASWRAALARLGPGADPLRTVIPPEPPPIELPAAAADGFQRLHELAVGDQGVVVAARQLALDRGVVLKCAAPGAATGWLAHEAHVAAALEHPAIIPVHDAGIGWMAMPHLRGQSFAAAVAALWDRVPASPAVPGSHDLHRSTRCAAALPSLVEALLRIAQGLAFAHERGVVHRDVTPGNIHLAAPGAVVLLDWGIAAPLDTHIATLRDPAAGTPAWLAPETACGADGFLTPALDVHGLGACLFHLLTGMVLREGDAAACVAAAAATAMPLTTAQQAALADAPIDLAALVQRSLSIDPSARGSAAGFAEALRTWLRGSGDASAVAAAVANTQEALAAATAATRARNPTKAWPCYLRALAAADSAAARSGGRPDLAATRIAVRVAFAEAATAVGDYVLATTVLAPVSDLGCHDPAWRTALDRATTGLAHRHRASARLRTLHRLAALLAVLLAALAAVLALS